MGKIIVYREKSIYDGILPYTCYLNEEIFKIYPGKTLEIELKKEINHFQIKYLYFRTQKIEISSGVCTSIILRALMGRLTFVFLALAFLIFFVFSSIDIAQNTIISDGAFYLAIFSFSVLIFYNTVGYKRYLKPDIISITCDDKKKEL